MGSRSLVSELDKLKKEIKEVQSDLAEAKGELKGLYKRLANEFGVKELEDAKGLLEEYELEIEKLTALIDSGIEKIHTKLKDE